MSLLSLFSFCVMSAWLAIIMFVLMALTVYLFGQNYSPALVLSLVAFLLVGAFTGALLAPFVKCANCGGRVLFQRNGDSDRLPRVEGWAVLVVQTLRGRIRRCPHCGHTIP